MIIKHPDDEDTNALKDLWQEAFDDDTDFIDKFFSLVYSKNRAMLLKYDNKVACSLYWFDCTFENKPVAYIYAVATFKEFQKKGFCNALMKSVHRYLKEHGYIGACLVPSSEALFDFYGKMGYKKCIYNNESILFAKKQRTELTKITKSEYNTLRKKYLPEKSILQENENLDFLEIQAEFFKGTDFIFAASKEKGLLFVPEILGNQTEREKIIYTLNCNKGLFRTLGNTNPFAMYLPFFDDQTYPEYLGFGFD